MLDLLQAKSDLDVAIGGPGTQNSQLAFQYTFRLCNRSTIPPRKDTRRSLYQKSFAQTITT